MFLILGGWWLVAGGLPLDIRYTLYIEDIGGGIGGFFFSADRWRFVLVCFFTERDLEYRSLLYDAMRCDALQPWLSKEVRSRVNQRFAR